MSAAIFVAGLAVASAQAARDGRDGYHRASGQDQRAPAAALGAVSRGQDNRHRNQHGSVTHERASLDPRGRSDLRPLAKHNDASLLAPRGRSGRNERNGMASDRSILDRAMAQGRLASERNHPDQRERRDYGGLGRATRRGQRAAAANEHGPQDVARTAKPRRPPDQGMGSAAREAGKARRQAGERDQSQARGHVGGKAKHQAHSNHEQAHGQAHEKARSHARNEAPEARRAAPQRRQDEVRKAQAALNQQGFNVGDPDGKLGPRTKQALIAFQKQRGFKTTGKMDHTTLDALHANGAAPVASPQNNQPGPAQAPAQATPGQATPAQAGPDQAAPPAVPLSMPGEPGTTTGQGSGQPAMPPTGAVPVSPQMPDNGASGRVPSGSLQQNDQEGTVPGGNQR